MLCEDSLKSISVKFPVSMCARGQIQHHTLPVCLQADPNPLLVFSHRSNLFSGSERQPACTFLCLQNCSIFVSGILLTYIHWSPKIYIVLGRSSPYCGWFTGDLLPLPFLSRLLLAIKLDLTATRKTKLRRCQAGKMWKPQLFLQVKQFQKWNKLRSFTTWI